MPSAIAVMPDIKLSLLKSLENSIPFFILILPVSISLFASRILRLWTLGSYLLFSPFSPKYFDM